jgi:hypothetical protein
MHMLGRLLMLTVGGLVAWKYRDSIRDYVKGNLGPDKVDGALRSVQETSENLFDRAKEQISSRIGTAREKVRSGAAGSRQAETASLE